jgi:hypothetical protein
MDAGIRAPGADNLHPLIGHKGERLFKALLNTETGFLALPAVERRAVVFNAERDAHEPTI